MNFSDESVKDKFSVSGVKLAMLVWMLYLSVMALFPKVNH